MKKHIKFSKILGLLLCLTIITFINSAMSANAAEKDKKKPTITLTPKTTKPTKSNVSITTKVQDASGVKSVKWAAGEQNTTYFQKQGTALKLTEKNTATISAKNNGAYTVFAEDKAGNKQIKKISISNIDQKAPSVKLSYSVMNQIASINVKASDASKIKSIVYLNGNVTDKASTKWEKAKDLKGATTLKVKTSGNYSFLVTDNAGNKTAATIKVNMEFRAAWISFLEFKKTGYTEKEFKSRIDEMYDNCVNLKMNAVIVHVRPFGDAFYPSPNFPWSEYVSGTQGKNPGFDPLKYMVSAAHDRGLEFHAWMNPYRVTTSSTSYTKLAKNNPARVWKEDGKKENDRNTLSFGGNLYFNPASSEVQNMIVEDIQYIVKNYDVDGINFDDYFYPTLGSNYKTTFDNVEYDAYKKECTDNKIKALSIADWRRNNVSTLVADIYSAIKKIDSSVRFGISPAGVINTLTLDDRHYVDIKRWLSSSGYVDYIAPQIYWSMKHPTAAFGKMVNEWASIRTSNTVSLYIAIANYKAGEPVQGDPSWASNTNELKTQVEYARGTGKVDGFCFYRYESMVKKNDKAVKETQNLLSILN